MLWTHWFAGMMDAGPTDRLYNCLPMYHSVGGVAAPGALLVAGGSVICREKFSARAFWPDVAASGATIFQYIGELCRYLLATDIPAERASRRTACAWPAATACRAMSGRGSRRASGFRRSWNSTPPPKAISRSTTWRESRAPSAGSRAHLARSFRSPCCAITRKPASRSAAPTELCIAAARGADRRGRLQDHRRRGAVRGLYTDQGANGEEDPAPCVRPGRCPGSTGGDLDAQGRRELLLFRRPGRRHLPLEGRECRQHGGRAPCWGRRPASSPPRSMASQSRVWKAAPAWRRWT